MAAALVVVALGGCANPGPPRAPSLQIPEVVTALTAERRGDGVELRFSLPQRTTDGVALRSGSVTAQACRSIGAGPCKVIAGLPTRSFVVQAGVIPQPVEMRDVLPTGLREGAPRLMAYRIELRNSVGKTDGFSDPAYAAAGSAPPPVTALHAQGSRLGVLLTWQPAEAGGTVLLRREDVGAAASKARSQTLRPSATASSQKRGGMSVAQPGGADKAEPNVVLLDAEGDPGARLEHSDKNATLDTTAVAEEPYLYSAERRATVELGGHTLLLHSERSAVVPFTLHDVFPPPVPADLSAAGYAEGGAPGVPASYAVDLIWQPVDEPELAGYNVYRQDLDATGKAIGEKQRLTGSPAKMPAFHDSTAKATERYRYSVTALDTKGNESGAAVTVVEPESR